MYFIPRGEFEEIELPVDFCDASFDNDVIRGVMYLIKNRFGSAYTYLNAETAAISKDKTFFCEYRKYAVKMRDDSVAENQELLELRDLIYKFQNSSVESEEPETLVSFPYRTKQRVVVFGGHATWLKVIVKLLPNVKFIDPYADPDVNTIRNADVVWLQTNAMSHNKYNKIMEIVRLKKIPVKYFAYASAEKCAV